MGEKPHFDLESRTYTCIYILFVRLHSRIHGRLSLNICREVFIYIPLEQRYLASILNKQLLVYDLHTPTSQVTSNRMKLNLTAKGLVMVGDNELFIVGGEVNRVVLRVDIWTGKVRKEGELRVVRRWPGVVVYMKYVWVFGGNTGPSLSSVDRFDRRKNAWEPARDMLTSKTSFTPCVHQGFIYLAEMSPVRKQLERLEPETQEYVVLGVELWHSLYSSVAVIVNGELLVVNFSNEVGTWRIGSSATQLTPSTDIHLHEIYSTFTNMAPVHCRDAYYWLNGMLPVQFDLKTSTISKYQSRLVKSL